MKGRFFIFSILLALFHPAFSTPVQAVVYHSEAVHEKSFSHADDSNVDLHFTTDLSEEDNNEDSNSGIKKHYFGNTSTSSLSANNFQKNLSENVFFAGRIVYSFLSLFIFLRVFRL